MLEPVLIQEFMSVRGMVAVQSVVLQRGLQAKRYVMGLITIVTEKLMKHLQTKEVFALLEKELAEGMGFIPVKLMVAELNVM